MNGTSLKSRVVKLLVVVALLLAGVSGRGQGTNLTALLQAGLFAEQGDHDMATAIADYQMLAAQYDKDRQLAATAVFRLGECYRAQNETNEAVAQYERVLKDFADQKVLVTMSEENLKGLGGDAGGHMAERLNKIIARVPPGETVSPGGANPELVHELEMVKKLQGMTNFDDVIQQAPTLVPDATLNNFINQYNQSVLDILRLSTDYGPDSEQMRKAETIKDGLMQTILKRLEGLKQALMTELAAGGGGGAMGSTVGGTPAEMAAPSAASEEDQEIQKIQEMVRNSPDLINAPTGDGNNTPLSKAAANGWLKVAAYLLDHGAQVNPSGTSPLYAAARAGNRAMVEFLLGRGAEVNGADSSGETALRVAVAKKFKSVVEVLVTNGADVNLASSGGNMSPLHLAASGPDDIVKLLLAAGARVNAEDRGGQTPLDIATFSGKPETIQLLLAAKADANLVSGDAELPLCAAAEFRDTNVVQMLLDAGANVNAEDKDGRTALSYAAKRGAQDIIKVLLGAKADPDGGRSDEPLLAAIASKDTGSVELLLAAGADVSKAGPFYLFDITISDVDYMNHRQNMTPLWLALYMKQAPMVKLLLKYKADPNDVTMDGHSLMFRATGSPDMLLAMLERGGDANAQGNQKVTMLELASLSHDPEVAGILLQHGADPNLRENQGQTALHMAILRAKDVKFVQLLLEHGADPNVRDNYGKTPLMLANGLNDKSLGGEIIALLHSHGALDKLPDWDRITVSRLETHFSEPVFYQATNGWNHFTLFETLLNFYGMSGPRPPIGQAGTTFAERLAAITQANDSPSGLPFPDLTHITIVRPSHDSTNETRIAVNLLNDAGAIDSARDMPLEFGDVVEVPESDHPLGDTFTGLPQSEMDALANPLKGQVQLVVKGKATEIAIYPIPGQALLEQILSGNSDAKAVLLSSSDLSRVKVTRHDAKTGRDQTWTVDCSSVSSMASRDTMSPEAQVMMIEANRNHPPSGGQPTWVNDLWLRNRDVIEVPERQ